jgi:hypothetical protein
MKRFIAVQIGARNGYAIPTGLEKAGMLKAFYTDIVGNSGFGEILAIGKDLPVVGDRF